MEKLVNGKNPKFGDIVENRTAGHGNPTRLGVFVRVIYRTGRINPGKSFECTNLKGKFWEVSPRADLHIGDNIILSDLFTPEDGRAGEMVRRDVSLTPVQLDMLCEALQRWQNTFLARNPDTTHMTDDELRKARYKAYQTAQQPLELLRELHSWSYPERPTPKPPAGEA